MPIRTAWAVGVVKNTGNVKSTYRARLIVEVYDMSDVFGTVTTSETSLTQTVNTGVTTGLLSLHLDKEVPWGWCMNAWVELDLISPVVRARISWTDSYLYVEEWPESLYKLGDRLVGDGAEWTIVVVQPIDSTWGYVLQGRGGAAYPITTIPDQTFAPGSLLLEAELVKLSAGMTVISST